MNSVLLVTLSLLTAPGEYQVDDMAGVVESRINSGFFAETDIGGMFTAGGNVSEVGQRLSGVSNFEAYLQLGVGYQLVVRNGGGLVGLGFHLGIGSNSQNCFGGFVGPEQRCQGSDSFSLVFLSTSAGYLFRVAERVYLGPKILLGYALSDPSPVAPVAGSAVSGSGAFQAGAALSVEYATRLDHFSVGLDVALRSLIGPNIYAVQFFPRIQYTF
jgi:hypothetical protein